MIAERASKSRLPIYSRERFVEDVFYPEVYREGTLCVGFNLPFDLTRIALHAGVGRGQNRRKFRIVLSHRIRWHDLRIESATGKAAAVGRSAMPCSISEAIRAVSHSAEQSHSDRQGIGKRFRSHHRSFAQRNDAETCSADLAGDFMQHVKVNPTPSCASIDCFRCPIATQVSGRPAGDLGTAE